MHVFNSAEVAIESGGEDDDGDVRAAATKKTCNLGTELAGSEVEVEDGYVGVVEEFYGFFNGRGRETLVAVLAEDCCAEMQVCGLIIEQENADVRTNRRQRVCAGLRWIRHQSRF